MGDFDFSQYSPMQIHEVGHEYGYNLGYQDGTQGKNSRETYNEVINSTELPEVYKTGFRAGYIVGLNEGKEVREISQLNKKIYRKFRFRQSFLIIVVAVLLLVGCILFGYLDSTGQTLTDLVFG